MLQPNSKTVLFFNPFQEDFSHAWNKEEITVKSGERKYMPMWLAEHMRKHLVDREMARLGLPYDFRSVDPNNPKSKFSRPLLEAQCIIEAENMKETTSVLQELELLNSTPVNQQASNGLEKKEQAEQAEKSWCDTCDSKGIKHKKTCPKYKALKENEEFAGLKQM